MQITIALAKGRIAKEAARLFEKCGMDVSELAEDSRKLVFYDGERKFRLILVKPSDVPVYVDHGVADIGIAGKDTLMEAALPLYEMLDLRYARCRICVAGYREPREKRITSNLLRVATKYPRIARMHYDARGENIEIIKLHGSIELAPILGLADVIVDIVESGRTLVDNGLDVLEEVAGNITARLVVNRASLKTRSREIAPLIERMRKVIEEENA